MIGDPKLTITDVQAVLRHKSPLSTQVYAKVQMDELISRAHDHYARRAAPPPPRLHPAYDGGDLAVLFGDGLG